MPSNAHMQECMNNCQECKEVCEETLTHMLMRGGDHMDPEHIRLMLDCIQICQTSADFLRRQSSYHIYTCKACAEICEACAESCEDMGKEHTTLQECADVCYRCAESCREMSRTARAA